MSIKGIRARLRGWGRRQMYSLFSSLGFLLSHKISTTMTVLVIAIAMMLPLGLWLTMEQLRSVNLDHSAMGSVSVFMQSTAGEREARELVERTRAQLGTDIPLEFSLVSPEQGLEQFQAASGMGEILQLFDGNPLPWVLTITPADEIPQFDPERWQMLAEGLRSDPAVESVNLDYKWLQRLSALLDLGRALVTVLMVLFSLAVVVVVANTIRLDVANRAGEIQVMSLVGAGNGFIRQPFLYSGFWYGVMGASLALLLLLFCLLYLQQPLQNLLAVYGRDTGLSRPGFLHAVAVVFAGGMLGFGGAWVSVQRYLVQLRPGGLLGRA